MLDIKSDAPNKIYGSEIPCTLLYPRNYRRVRNLLGKHLGYAVMRARAMEPMRDLNTLDVEL